MTRRAMGEGRRLSRVDVVRPVRRIAKRFAVFQDAASMRGDAVQRYHSPNRPPGSHQFARTDRFDPARVPDR